MFKIVIILLLSTGALSLLDEDNVEDILKSEVNNDVPIPSEPAVQNEEASVNDNVKPKNPVPKPKKAPVMLDKEQINMLAQKVIRIHGVDLDSADEENMDNIAQLRNLVSNVEKNLNEKVILSQQKKKLANVQQEVKDTNQPTPSDTVQTLTEEDVTENNILENADVVLETDQSKTENTPETEVINDDVEVASDGKDKIESISDIAESESQTDKDFTNENIETRDEPINIVHDKIPQDDLKNNDNEVTNSENEGITITELNSDNAGSQSQTEEEIQNIETVDESVDSIHEDINSKPEEEGSWENTPGGEVKNIDVDVTSDESEEIKLETNPVNAESEGQAVQEDADKENTNENIETIEENRKSEDNITDIKLESVIEPAINDVRDINKGNSEETLNVNDIEPDTSSLNIEAQRNATDDKTVEVNAGEIKTDDETQQQPTEINKDETTEFDDGINGTVHTEPIEDQSDDIENIEEEEIIGECSLGEDCDEGDDTHKYFEQQNSENIEEEKLESKVEDSYLQTIIKYVATILN